MSLTAERLRSLRNVGLHFSRGRTARAVEQTLPTELPSQSVLDLVNNLHHRLEASGAEIRAEGRASDIYSNRRLAGLNLARRQRVTIMGKDADLTLDKVNNGVPVEFNQYDHAGRVVRTHSVVEQLALEPHLNTITHEVARMITRHDLKQVSDSQYRETVAALRQEEAVLMTHSRTYQEAHPETADKGFLESRKGLEAWAISKDPLRAYRGTGWAANWRNGENWLLAAKVIEGPYRDSFYSRPDRRHPDQRRELFLQGLKEEKKMLSKKLGILFSKS